MHPSIVDFHCQYMVDSIERRETALITCLNFLKNHASDPRTRSDWLYIGQQLVMAGHLKLNDQNDFVVMS